MSNETYYPDPAENNDSLHENEEDVISSLDQADDEILDQKQRQFASLFDRFERSYRARRIRELVKAPLPRTKRRSKKRGTISAG